MSYPLEVGDIVLDSTKTPLFVVKTYLTSRGDRACDCVLAEDGPLNDDSWQNPLFYRMDELAKVFSPSRFWSE
jgi:hypothetical protein